MRRGRFAAYLIVLTLVGAACSNDAVLVVEVDYRARDCAGLAREFGGYLEEEVEHIQATGDPRYFAVTRPGQPRVLRKILSLTEDDFSDRDDLLLFAPIEHVKQLGSAIRRADLTCAADQLAAGSEAHVKESVRSTLLADLSRRAEGPAVRTWAQWWATWYELTEEEPGRRLGGEALR